MKKIWAVTSFVLSTLVLKISARRNKFGVNENLCPCDGSFKVSNSAYFNSYDIINYALKQKHSQGFIPGLGATPIDISSPPQYKGNNYINTKKAHEKLQNLLYTRTETPFLPKLESIDNACNISKKFDSNNIVIKVTSANPTTKESSYSSPAPVTYSLSSTSPMLASYSPQTTSIAFPDSSPLVVYQTPKLLTASISTPASVHVQTSKSAPLTITTPAVTLTQLSQPLMPRQSSTPIPLALSTHIPYPLLIEQYYNPIQSNSSYSSMYSSSASAQHPYSLSIEPCYTAVPYAAPTSVPSSITTRVSAPTLAPFVAPAAVAASTSILYPALTSTSTLPSTSSSNKILSVPGSTQCLSTNVINSKDKAVLSSVTKTVPTSTNPQNIPFYDNDQDSAYVNEEQIHKSQSTIPADPVSISLAYKNLFQNSDGKKYVSEDRLAFGHRQHPSNGQICEEISKVPEERLITVDKPILEFNQKRNMKK